MDRPRLETKDVPAALRSFISVVAPVRNEAPFMARTLDSLLAQRYPGKSFEILVVDGQSTDRTREIVHEYQQRHDNIHLLDNPRRWSSAARNVGVRNANGDFVLVVDGHCELTNQDYLANVCEAFERTGADCLGRPQPLQVSDGTLLQRAIAAARSSPLGHHPDSFIYSRGEQFVPAHSVAVAYRRSVFQRIGMFDESFDACEDVELNHRIDRAGLRCLFTDKIELPYVPRNSLSGLFGQLMRYGRGRVRLSRKHRDTLSVRTMLPALFVCWLILGIPSSLIAFWFGASAYGSTTGSTIGSTFGLLYAASLGVYAMVALAFSLLAAKREGRTGILVLLPLVFFTIHTAAGTGMMLEILAPQKPPQSTRLANSFSRKLSKNESTRQSTC